MDGGDDTDYVYDNDSDSGDFFAGNDILIGGPGDDHLYGDSGQNWLFGGAGLDHLYSEYEGVSLLYGEGDDDWIESSGASAAYGGPGKTLSTRILRMGVTVTIIFTAAAVTAFTTISFTGKRATTRSRVLQAVIF